MLNVRIVRSVAEFIALEADWNKLARSHCDVRLTQTFNWARLALDSRPETSEADLLCATVWRNERLVGVWPMVQTTKRWVKRVETLCCPMREEYCDPLVAMDGDPLEVLRLMLSVAQQHGDVFFAYAATATDPLHGFLENQGILRLCETQGSYQLAPREGQSFDDYLAGHSSHFQHNLKAKRKRLSALGELKFELLETVQGSTQTLRWMLEEKKRWCLRHKKTCDWIDLPEMEQFFSAASALQSEFGRLGLFCLTLDGKVIAAFLATIDPKRAEMFVTTFDPAYARYSPGMLLIEDLVRWCFEHRVVFDMRPYWQGYKEQWANEIVPVSIHHVGLTWKGAMVLLPAFIDASLRAKLRRVFTLSQRKQIRSFLTLVPNLLRSMTPFKASDRAQVSIANSRRES